MSQEKERDIKTAFEEYVKSNYVDLVKINVVDLTPSQVYLPNTMTDLAPYRDDATNEAFSLFRSAYDSGFEAGEMDGIASEVANENERKRHGV